MRMWLFILPLLIAATPPPAGMRAVRSNMVLKVVNRDKAANVLADKIGEMGGYFTALSESELKGRLPPEKLQSFLTFVENQGAVIDRSQISTDMTFTLSDLRARLTAAESTMQELSKLLRDLPSHALTEVRAELARRIAEIERFRGQIRLSETNLQFADVTIAFQFQNSEIPPPPSVSSFVWLNSLGVDQLMQAVGSER